MSTQPTCYRCDELVDDVHRIRLSSTHEGDNTGRFQNVDRRICLDCLAAIGMLEFDREADRGKISSLQTYLSPVHSLRGGD